MKHFAWAFFIFCCAVGGSLELLRRAPPPVFNSAAFIHRERENRNPAAIRKVYDYSHLQGERLQSAVHHHLMSEAKLLQSLDGPGIQLNHFVVSAADGQKVFACDLYDTIELAFIAEGLLASGSHPTMVIETPCRFTQDINRIDPVWVPFNHLSEVSAGNMELNIESLSQPLHMTFEAMPPFWPNNWILQKIHFYSSTNQNAQMTFLVDNPATNRVINVYFQPAEER